MQGCDRNMWDSKPNVNGVYSWKKAPPDMMRTNNTIASTELEVFARAPNYYDRATKIISELRDLDAEYNNLNIGNSFGMTLWDMPKGALITFGDLEKSRSKTPQPTVEHIDDPFDPRFEMLSEYLEYFDEDDFHNLKKILEFRSGWPPFKLNSTYIKHIEKFLRETKKEIQVQPKSPPKPILWYEENPGLYYIDKNGIIMHHPSLEIMGHVNKSYV